MKLRTGAASLPNPGLAALPFIFKPLGFFFHDLGDLERRDAYERRVVDARALLHQVSVRASDRVRARTVRVAHRRDERDDGVVDRPERLDRRADVHEGASVRAEQHAVPAVPPQLGTAVELGGAQPDVRPRVPYGAQYDVRVRVGPVDEGRDRRAARVSGVGPFGPYGPFGPFGPFGP